MGKRSIEEGKAIRAALVPGACFVMQNGTVGKVLARTASEDGVTLRVSYVAERLAKEASTNLANATHGLDRLCGVSEYDDAKRAHEARKAQRPKQTREPREHPLEARVRKLEEHVAWLERRLGVRMPSQAAE